MEYQYFKFVTDLENLKSQYRELCKKHHPDLGGDVEIMKQINIEYSTRLKSGQFNVEFEDSNSNIDIEESLRDIIEKTVTMKKIIIEICGRWVWFSGETWRYKTILKSLGCLWSKNKNAWYWKPSTDKYKFHKPLTTEQIRLKYGSTIVKTKDCESLA